MTLREHSHGTAPRLKRAFWGSLCVACLWTCVSLTAFSQTDVQRDQQALTILGQTIAVGGGRDLLTSIQDITETGTVKFDWDEEVTGSITIKGRGLRQFRMDVELPDGRRSTVVNAASGSLTEENGRFRPIYRQSAADLGGLTLPYLSLIETIDDSSTRIIYRGLATHNDASVHDIRVENVHTSRQDPTGARGEREGRDIYIDPKSFLVTAISDKIHFTDHGDDGVPHEILYSNYQSKNGIATPLTISETLRGVTGVTLQLNEVRVNSGLTDSDFRER